MAATNEGEAASSTVACPTASVSAVWPYPSIGPFSTVVAARLLAETEDL